MIEKAITLNADTRIQQVIRTAQIAEDLEFDTCYIADQGFILDPYVTLAAIACNTKRIKIGPGVTHPYTRHPVVTAVSVASLDHLSGGRAFLGIGAGGSRTLVPLEIPRSKPLQLTREMAEIARLLWQCTPVNYSSDYYHITNATLGFQCRPDIEIHWAARSPKMLELGGELADVNLLFGIPFFELPNVIARVKKGIQKACRTPRITCTVNLVFDEASKEFARARSVYRLVDSTDEVKNQLGLTAGKIDLIRKLVTTTGPKSAAYLVDDDLLKHYVIQGDPSACADQISEMISKLDLTGITIEIPEPENSEKLLTFAADVLSRI